MTQYSTRYDTLGGVTFCGLKPNDESLAVAVKLWCKTKGFFYNEIRTSFGEDVFVDIHVFTKFVAKQVEEHLNLFGWQKD